MTYQETGRFGRITKNLRKLGFSEEMKGILHDSGNFSHLKKKEQVEYLEQVMERMIHSIGKENTNSVLFACGEQCCGKSWAKFVRDIWETSDSVEVFFETLNREEAKYHTTIRYFPDDRSIVVNRSKCICGLINKGDQFKRNKSFCLCSSGHMAAFFNAVFQVDQITLIESIYSGGSKCEWKVQLKESGELS